MKNKQEGKAGHTPGPLLYREELDGTYVIETDAPLEEMEEIAQGLTRENAILLAAAPDILRALEALLEYQANGTPVQPGAEVWDDVKAVIAKAGGREGV